MSVRHALLALLSEGPKYGLQLRQEFEARTGEVWPLNVGQVYTTLQRLERDGLVESDDDERRGPAAGLPDHRRGAAELATWLRTPPDLTSPPRDELVIKVLVALRLPGVDVHEVIQVHRRYLVELMQQWTRLKDDAAEHEVGFVLVGRRRAVPAGLGHPLARRGRRPPRAAARPIRRRRPAPALPPRLRRRIGGAAMSALELRDVSKVYGEGADRGARAARRRPLGRAGRAGRGDGAERIGQEHAADDRRQSRGADERRGARRRSSACRGCRATTGPACGAARSATCSRTSTCSPG